MNPKTIITATSAIIVFAGCAQSQETPISKERSAATLKGGIHYAASVGEVTVVSQLLNSNKSLLDARDYNEMTPLLVAAREGKIDVVNLLLGKGADINAQCKGGGTALHLAAYNGQTEVIKVLLSKHADATIKNSSGKTPLQVATEERQETAIKIFKDFR